jgi:hypothetical protein
MTSIPLSFLQLPYGFFSVQWIIAVEKTRRL